MKKLLALALVAGSLVAFGCKDNKSANSIKFGISAEYPPFEYYDNEKLAGFDIELAQMVAKELGKEAVFEDMQFNSILPAVENGIVDAGISAITITSDRKKTFDFSEPYFEDAMSTVYKKNKPVTKADQLKGKKIGCQLGTTMQIWLSKNYAKEHIVAMDNSDQIIEALKTGHLDVVLVDAVQANVFAAKNPGLASSRIAKSEDGFGFVFKKGSALTEQVNKALKVLKEKGEIKKLEKKWVEGTEWIK